MHSKRTIWAERFAAKGHYPLLRRDLCPILNADVADEASLTAQAVVAGIPRIEPSEETLHRRASGLTWMIWGIVTPAIFLSYTLFDRFAGVSLDVGAGNPYAPLLPILWMPWAGAGIAATAILWRSVGSILPLRRARVWEGIASGVIVVGLVFAGFAAIGTTHLPIDQFAWVLMAQGIGLTAIGILGLNCNDAKERGVWIVGGILLVVTSLGATLIFNSAPRSFRSARQLFSLISPIACGVVFFGGGMYMARRVRGRP